VGVDGNGHNQISGGIQLTGPDVAGLTITQQAYDGLFRQATEENVFWAVRTVRFIFLSLSVTVIYKSFL
jgi:hypothetical protein